MLVQKLGILAVVTLIMAVLLAACGPASEPVVIKETSVVIEHNAEYAFARSGERADIGIAFFAERQGARHL